MKNSSKLKAPDRQQKERYLLLFFVSFVGMLMCFLPSIIKNHGIFMYYGDFNSQQLMFYKHAQQMVKEGNMAWDWGTDLGSGFVSTYSFYLLGSPFFWLTTLFPVGSTVYLMPWLLSLKAGVASVCAYAYIRCFIENKDAAAVGAMLYAFSGFQTYNVFFNHFHDATAVFPLVLLGFEVLVKEKKRGLFALAVACTALINYYFFVGTAVFVVIYFFLRCSDKNFEMDMKIFFSLVFEAVAGALIAGVILLPSVLQVMLNSRVDSRFIGLDYILYNDKARIPRIVQAFFTLSDMPARVNLFDVDSARWASIAGYLPLFSMCGVLAYYRTREKKDWLCYSLIVFTIMAFVPFLNSSFQLFNSSYYARWFYMPILLFALMTSKILEEDRELLRRGYVPTSLLGIGFLLVGSLPKYNDKKEIVYGQLAQYKELYQIQIWVTLSMIVALGVLIYYVAKYKKKEFGKIALWMTIIACVICNTSEVWYGVSQGGENKEYAERAIFGGEKIDMARLDAKSSYQNPDSTFYRIDTSENVDNWCMFWNLSSMRCFHSTITPSIMDFYTELGQTRDVASRMEPDLYPLRALLSVKYYFKEQPEKQRNGEEEAEHPETIGNLVDFYYTDEMNGFNVYENDSFLPMGFGFDEYFTDEDIKNCKDKPGRTHMLLKGLVLTPEQAEKYSDVITHGEFDEDWDIDPEVYEENVEARKSMCCYSFDKDTHGFTAKINMDRPRLVFFSVPWEKGWSAEVNGVATDIEKVDYGLMAVLVPAGDSTIHFSYHTYGLDKGLMMTIAGAVMLIAYLLYMKKTEGDKQEKTPKPAPKKKEEKKEEEPEDTSEDDDDDEEEEEEDDEDEEESFVPEKKDTDDDDDDDDDDTSFEELVIEID